jgi:phytoene synthase
MRRIDAATGLILLYGHDIRHYAPAMNDSVGHSRQYCDDLVRAQDEDRWLASRYAAAPSRRRLIALYAFHAETRRIPSVVTEPPLGEIRLQWWRDAFEEIRTGKPPRAHPVVEEIAAAGLAASAYEALVEEAIDAGARPLYGEPFADLEELETWLAQADGVVDAMAAMLVGGDSLLCNTARQAGTAFSLAREGRAQAPDLAEAARARAIELSNKTAGADEKLCPARGTRVSVGQAASSLRRHGFRAILEQSAYV